MSFIDKIIGTGASSILDSVSNVVDKFVTTGAEKAEINKGIQSEINRHLEIIATTANAELDSQLKDMQDARKREIDIATSDHSPLINKVIQPILAIMIVISVLVIWSLILFRNYEPKTNEAMIIGALTAFAGNVLNYYFGSSSGSKDKSKILDKR